MTNRPTDNEVDAALEARAHPNIRPEIQARIATGKLVALEEWKTMRVNSYEQQALIPLFDVDTLAHFVANCLKNTSPIRYPPASYDEAAMGVLLPEAMKRLALVVDGARILAGIVSGNELVTHLGHRANYFAATKLMVAAGVDVKEPMPTPPPPAEDATTFSALPALHAFTYVTRDGHHAGVFVKLAEPTTTAHGTWNAVQTVDGDGVHRGNLCFIESTRSIRRVRQ